MLCNDSKVEKLRNGGINCIGDPTENALVYFAFSKGVDKEFAEQNFPRVNEIPFDSDRKLMTTINKIDKGDRIEEGCITDRSYKIEEGCKTDQSYKTEEGCKTEASCKIDRGSTIDKSYRIITKGAPDVLLNRCTKIYEAEGIRPITVNDRKVITDANSNMAGRALRILAVAIKDTEKMPVDMTSEKLETDLVFLGLAGMIDPPRPEVREAVKICEQAGIRPVMITGDHRDTAAAIAKDLGIIKGEEEVITGSELNKISEAEFDKTVERYSVYARVSPEHKVRIVESWKKKGRVVAMTGDGVNDAPALKAADIGIGMGITGTDVAKGVSNMVLADDNFATIVTAVEEGRKIYGNIKKTIQFLLSSNLGEVVTLFVATILNTTILYPIHILWVNLVTDTLPALALGIEKAESDVMHQKPRNSKQSFFADGMGLSIIYQGICKGILTLAAFYTGLSLYSKEVAVTMAFATLGMIQLTHSLNARSNSKSLLKLGVFTNKYLNAALLVSTFLQLAVIAFPFLNNAFRVVQLNLVQWGIVFAASFAIIPVVEIVKALTGLRRKI